MGFHKRFITKDIIKSTNDDQIGLLFNSDTLIFNDDWSYNFYNLFLEGEDIKDIKNKLNKNENNKEK